MDRPVGKKVTSVDLLAGVCSFLGAFSRMLTDPEGEFERNRATSITDKIGDITVDTCVPSDTGVWETGIRRETVEGEWVFVSQYESDEEAKRGHEQWVALMKEEPTCELKDIDIWNLPDDGEE